MTSNEVFATDAWTYSPTISEEMKTNAVATRQRKSLQRQYIRQKLCHCLQQLSRPGVNLYQCWKAITCNGNDGYRALKNLHPDELQLVQKVVDLVSTAEELIDLQQQRLNQMAFENPPPGIPELQKDGQRYHRSMDILIMGEWESMAGVY